jgi:UDP-2,4-diacetamido-2,4,6-trideoxy-beta-L-altropyranose hydrolase
LRSNGWRCEFAVRPETIAVCHDLTERRFEVFVTEDHTVEIMAARWPDGCDLLVIDDYTVWAEDETPLRSWTRKLLVIDDLAERQHDGDLLLDPTLGRVPKAYDGLTPEHCAIFHGPCYALLRPEFSAVRCLEEAVRDANQVLVMLGATDPDNATAKVLAALRGTGFAIDVVLGAGAPHLEAVRVLAADMEERVTLHVGVGAAAISNLMTRATLAIGAAGSGAWERCALGLPSLLVVIAENQQLVASSLSTRGAALSLGNINSIDGETIASAVCDLMEAPDQRANISETARVICDARGAARLAIHLTGANDSLGMSVTLRPPARLDCDTILGWQREPSARRHFHNPFPPSEEEHRVWFERQWESEDASLLIIEVDGEAAGILRLDPVCPDKPTLHLLVSILVASSWRGRGVAKVALDTAHRLWPEATFVASVKAENDASHRLFRAAGYIPRDGEINYSRLSELRSEENPNTQMARK